jgi:glycosyltransferase involved in cell wall biosynthesis
MKILHVIDSIGLYGAEVMLLNLMSEQVSLGLEPVLASIGTHSQAEKPLEREARRRGLAVEPFRMKAGPNLSGLAAMLRFARQQRVDVIHSHGYKGNILFGLLPARWRGAPMVTTVHGWGRTGGIGKLMLYQWLDTVALRFIDRIVLVNEAMKDRPRYGGSNRARTEVVPNGLAFDPDGETDLDPGVLDFCRRRSTIGAAGRLSPVKGFDLLLKAFSLLVRDGWDLQLVILGEGECRARLETLVKELRLETRVMMPGYLPSAGRYMPFFRAFVISSLTEGLPMVLLEAMQAGVPVVSSRVGGIPEALQQGKAGVLVSPANARELAFGVERVIEDQAGAARLVAAGKIIVKEKYSARAMAARYASVYSGVLNGGHKR